MSSASALHLSPAFSIAMTAISGASISLRYAKVSARWRKPVRTAGQRHLSHTDYLQWINIWKDNVLRCSPSLCLCLLEFWPAKDFNRVFRGPASTVGLSNQINISRMTFRNSEEKAMSWDTRRWKKQEKKTCIPMFYDSTWNYAPTVNEPYLVEVKLAHERAGEGVAVVHWYDNRPCVRRGEQGCYGL